MALRRRTLGRTGLSVTELGFGCTSFWARKVFPERKALAVLERAIEGGINFFDTGPSYAAGEAERRLGKVLRSLGSTKGLVISSKVGTHAAPDGRLYRDWSAEGVKTSSRRSLERLGIDRLQVLHLHGPTIASLQPELFEILADLKREGLVEFFGINSFNDKVIRHALTFPLFDSLMVEYNVIRKRNAALLDEITASGAAAVIAAPVAQALFRTSMWPTSLKAAWELARALKYHRHDLLAARRFQFLNNIAGITAPQAALAYVLRSQSFASAVFATTSVHHLKMNLAATDITLPPDVVRQIEALPDGSARGGQSTPSIAVVLAKSLLPAR
jgi:1-deoxyxylulose-5-phosphate synthase